MISNGLADLEAAAHDICVVGSGPVGITLALELARQGRRVLLLESGEAKATAAAQQLSRAHIVDPAVHDDMTLAVARRFGGTSNLWGARCQPFDPIDFVPRPGLVDAPWPITLEELRPFYDQACVYANCGAPVFSQPIPGVEVSDTRIDPQRLERFSNKPAFQLAHEAALESSPLIDVRLGVTVVDAKLAQDGRIQALTLSSLDGARLVLETETVVLAMGGLETTRFLLTLQRQHPDRFGGADGPLGRFYMAHLIGEVADITFANDAVDRAFDFLIDGRGSYARHRMIPSDETLLANDLTNVAFWPVVPPSSDPSHRSSILSMVVLALSIGPIGRLLVAEVIRKYHAPDGMKRWPHILNVMRGLPSAIAYAPVFFYRRYFAKMRLPGFFLRNPGRTYGLSFHAEHIPYAESRVWLGEEADALGLPRLVVDLKFQRADAEALLRAHQVLQSWLETTGLGKLTFRQPVEETVDAIMAIAAHGTHQIGTARMGADPKAAVVDRDLRCFDSPNLYVASSAVFPTSGQANPTLTAVALAVRLADHLATAVKAS